MVCLSVCLVGEKLCSCCVTDSKATYTIAVFVLPIKCALEGNMSMFWVNLEGPLEEGTILKGICQVAIQLVIWVCSPNSGKLVARTCILGGEIE